MQTVCAPEEHYWSDSSTRPYMRGMKNMIQALIRAGDYDKALSHCDRLEKECGDEITATSYRADIFLNTGYWQSAADAAISGHKLFPSESLIAAFAFFELGRYDDVLPHFIYGTLNYPKASHMLHVPQTLAPKTSDEISDRNAGVDLVRTLHDVRRNQSRRSKTFFQTLRIHPRINASIHEYEELAKKRDTQDSTLRRKVLNRLRRIRSFEFAQQEAEKLGEEMKVSG